MMTKTITVLVPTAKPSVKEISMAPQVHDLNGKVVGFLWDKKPNGDLFLLRIKEQLSQRFRLAGTNWRERCRMPADDAPIIEELARTSDLVINAIGD